MIFTIVLVCIAVIGSSNGRSYDVHFLIDNRLDSIYNTPTTNYNTNGIFNLSQRTSGLQLVPKVLKEEKVKIQVYYECLCPDCRDFDTNQFKDTVLKLGPYLDIHTYPYGNAKTYDRNGQYEFECQHGPEECYGNKLHACAIEILNNATLSVVYNSCLMDQSQAGRGSDDRAVDVCSRSMGIVNPDAVKKCAQSDRGTLLLKKYGDESKKAGFNAVPYILINGVQNDGDKFLQDVCKAFVNPPPPCRQ